MRKPTRVLAGSRELREWFRRTGRRLTDPDVAARVGCSPKHLANVAAGRFAPSLGLAVAIERETGVSVRLWEPLPAEPRGAA